MAGARVRAKAMVASPVARSTVAAVVTVAAVGAAPEDPREAAGASVLVTASP